MTEPSRYRLARTIASGGMATVYEAVAQGERGFERRVAIKRVLPQHAEDASVRRMFFDEARIASRLHHAGIVQVLDYGVVDGDDFIVMEYVDGIDAEKAVGRALQHGTRMGEALALHVIAEIAHALDYAHRLRDDDGEPVGIVHRDVSPHNVLLSWEGDVKLSDFGIALATQREEKTRTGVVKGKMSYMPLEQAAGQRVTGAADVYALGATLHALLAGGPPSDDPRQEPDIDPSISGEVRELVARCMAREPAERPSAEDVAVRAGKLAALGLARDARGALREWLAPLREGAGQVKALDDLMGLALVQSGDGRRFTVSREAPDPSQRRSSVPTEAATPAGAEPDPETQSSIHLPAARRSWTAVAVLSAVAVAAAVGVAVLADGEDADETDSLAATEVEPSPGEEQPTGEAPAAGETPAVEQPPPAPAEESETADPPVAGTAETRAPAKRRPRERRSGSNRLREAEATEQPAPSPEPEPETAPPAEGWVRIPRGTAGQERVFVDGAVRGFTPTVLRMPGGERHLVIRAAETDEVLFDRLVNVAAQHTRTSPLVVPR